MAKNKAMKKSINDLLSVYDNLSTEEKNRIQAGLDEIGTGFWVRNLLAGEYSPESEEEYEDDDDYYASTKKSKMKKDFVIGDMWDRIDILKDDLGCENLIEETYKVMPTVQANEILEYIARNHDIEFDEPEYMASTKKSMNKSKYSDIRKRLNKIGGFTKDEEKIEIDDDDVVEIEDEDGQKVIEIEDEEDHAEEVADGEESEDDNLNECNRNVKSKKTVKGMRANKKRMKMRKDDDDYIGDEDDDDEDDSARATGKPAPWELEDEEEEEANKRRKSVKRVKMRKAEDMPEDADEQQNINEKGSGSAGSDMPEDADDNQDENEKGSGNAGSELPEDADDQQDIKESARKARLARMRRSAKKSVNTPPVKKFSVTNGGSPDQTSYNQRYQQAPMVRDAIDGHFDSSANKSFDEIAMMNERIANLQKARRNPSANNGVPKKIR